MSYTHAHAVHNFQWLCMHSDEQYRLQTIIQAMGGHAFNNRIREIAMRSLDREQIDAARSRAETLAPVDRSVHIVVQEL